jgi:DNA-binding response OmpR family regulator
MAHTDRKPVLLVDAFDDERNMFAAYLAKAGFRVLAFADADDGFIAAARSDVELAIVRATPLQRRLDGVDIATALKAWRAEVPVIVLTTDPSDLDHPASDHVVMLPTLPKVLAHTVRALLVRRKAEAATMMARPTNTTVRPATTARPVPTIQRGVGHRA